MIAVLRSLVFYAVFYLGSVPYVLSAVAVTAWPQILRKVVRGWSSYHRACARWLLGIRLRTEGHQPKGRVLFAVKHESFYEAIDLPALLTNPVPFAKVQLLKLPFWGRAAGAFGVVPVERDQGAKALRAMIAAAKAHPGRPLVIFPEGTRVPHGTRPPLQAGFAGLYKLIGVPVVPVAVASGPLYHRRWKRSGTLRVRFGEPIPPGLPREEIEARVHAGINALND